MISWFGSFRVLFSEPFGYIFCLSFPSKFLIEKKKSAF
jgi:hypothetical protein